VELDHQAIGVDGDVGEEKMERPNEIAILQVGMGAATI
jgi:hypothetical protein